jgi:hypothetical protein
MRSGRDYTVEADFIPSQDAAEARFTLIAETALGELPGADGADLQLCQRVQLHLTPLTQARTRAPPRPRIGHPERKQTALDLLAGQPDGHIAEVDLGLDPRHDATAMSSASSLG